MYSSEEESAELTENSPAFIRKLWKIVESPETDGTIRWAADGTSFIVEDAVEFQKVLPVWYKHGNMASFIRQLNMYGFRKKLTHLDNGIHTANTMEYYHPNFMRLYPGRMANISRKIKLKTQMQGSKINTVMSQLQQACTTQDDLASQLELMRTKHVQLVNELNALRCATLKRLHPDTTAETKQAGSNKSSEVTGIVGDNLISRRVTVTSGNAELGKLLAREARARLELVEQQRKTLQSEHYLHKRELELRVNMEKARTEQETIEWSLRMKSRDQKLANLRLQNDILREELNSLHD